jgi:uncharacterized protein YbjT (DUF2867 family)
MPDHAATERYLAATGTPYTALRNGFYASTVPLLLGPALETGELVAPADGPVSWTAHADLADAAAAVLTDEGRFDGPTPPLTGPDALDLADIAGILTTLTGRPVRRIVADDDEWTAALTGSGMPAERAGMLLGMFQAARRGEFATTGPELEHLLQRPATPVRSILEAAVEQRSHP